MNQATSLVAIGNQKQDLVWSDTIVDMNPLLIIIKSYIDLIGNGNKYVAAVHGPDDMFQCFK